MLGSIAEGAVGDLAPITLAPVGTSPAKRARNRQRSAIRRLLLTGDLLGITVAVSVGGATAGARPGDVLLLLVVALPAMVLGAMLGGLYERDEQRAHHSTLDDLGPLFQLITIESFLALALAWLLGLTQVTFGGVVTFWVAAIVLMLAARAVARLVARRQPSYLQKTIIVGAGDVGQLVGRKLVQHSEFGIRLIGFVDSEPRSMREDLADVTVLGPPDDIAEIVRAHQIDRVVVAFSNDRHDLLVNLVRELRTLDVQIDLVPRLFEAVGPMVGIHTVEGLPLVGLPASHPTRIAWRVKRVADLVLSAILLLLAIPLVIWIVWRIKRDSPGPVLFRQTRLGQNMRPFVLLKFRSMHLDVDDEPHREYVRQIMDPSVPPTENNLYKLERSESVTKVGTWLRRTSLDELPQLINVLRGEMSLVGPRPCIEYETELFEPHHFDRFLVPAGMTGFWQVAARAHATFREALDLDAAYARNWSLGLDLRLLALTPLVVLRTRGTR